MNLDPIVFTVPYQRATPLLCHNGIVFADDMQRRSGNRIKLCQRRVGCFKTATTYGDCTTGISLLFQGGMVRGWNIHLNGFSLGCGGNWGWNGGFSIRAASNALIQAPWEKPNTPWRRTPTVRWTGFDGQRERRTSKGSSCFIRKSCRYAIVSSITTRVLA